MIESLLTYEFTTEEALDAAFSAFVVLNLAVSVFIIAALFWSVWRLLKGPGKTK